MHLETFQVYVSTLLRKVGGTQNGRLIELASKCFLAFCIVYGIGEGAICEGLLENR